MLFRMRSNTPFRMFRLLTVQVGFVHVDMRFNFEKCYKVGIELNGSVVLTLHSHKNLFIARNAAFKNLMN